MAFFDELKKSIGGAADYTVKKTGEVTGAAKIRMDIRSLNTKLTRCYENIGRTYYRCEKGEGENCAETISAFIVEADELKAEIAQLRVKLARLQGCVVCPACNSQISDQSIFCPICGVKLPEQPKEEDTVHPEEEEEETEDTPDCDCTADEDTESSDDE